MIMVTERNKIDNRTDNDSKSVLIICRFHICKSAYLLKFIYNSNINTHNDFRVTHRHGQSGKNLTYILVEVKQGSDLPPCFSFIFIYKCPFMVYSVPYFSHFCPFFCVISLFKRVFKCSVEAPCRVPKPNKAGVFLKRKYEG